VNDANDNILRPCAGATIARDTGNMSSIQIDAAVDTVAGASIAAFATPKLEIVDSGGAINYVVSTLHIDADGGKFLLEDGSKVVLESLEVNQDQCADK
jgi:hypothetical protein